MSDEIGDLLVVGFTGTKLSEEWPQRICEQLSRRELGGVIVFRFNVQDSAQLKSLLDGIKINVDPAPFVLVDQEGGKVQRLSTANGFKDWPSAKTVASTMSAESAEVSSYEMALMLREVGINFNCAPCVDCDFVPPSPPIGKVERSYGISPETVTRFAAAFVRGHRRAGVISCAKHFPGHGSAQGDTHQGLVDITVTWSENELQPYRQLHQAGLLDSVMVAHVVHSGVEPGLPAVFSKAWSRKLREEIGFDGVVVSDDLHMGAIQGSYSFDEVVAGAFRGGCDLFVYSNNPLAAKGVEGFAPDPMLPSKFKDAVVRLVDSGVISESRVRESSRRVRELRSKL